MHTWGLMMDSDTVRMLADQHRERLAAQWGRGHRIGSGERRGATRRREPWLRLWLRLRAGRRADAPAASRLACAPAPGC